MSTSTFAVPHVDNRSVGSTRTLLGALALSSPLWAVVSLTQAATREGFDLTRHPISMLSLGSLGWLQITNFVVVGVLAIAGAIGLKRTVPSRWAPRLVIAYGIGYILSGVFVMEPGSGFPAGTPMEQSGPLAWHTVVHLFVGTIAFIALTAALFVLGRHFARAGERGWATGARLAASAVIVANVLASAQLLAPSVVLVVGVIAGMLFLSLIAVKLRRQV